MSDIVIKGHTGIGGAVSGNALVASDNFSARYDLDRIAGVFSRPSHALVGRNYVGRILILDAANCKSGSDVAAHLQGLLEATGKKTVKAAVNEVGKANRKKRGFLRYDSCSDEDFDAFTYFRDREENDAFL